MTFTVGWKLSWRKTWVPDQINLELSLLKGRLMPAFFCAQLMDMPINKHEIIPYVLHGSDRH